LLAELEAWVSAASADAAVDGRRRTRGLVAQAAEEANLAGVLLDLAERDARVVVATTSARQHRGAIVLVGLDVVVVATEPGGMALVRSGAIATVRTAPGSPAVMGDRAARLRVGWAEALAVLAADRPRVRIGLAGGATCTGELRSVGTDVATVRLDGDGARVYVALDAIADVVVDDVRMTEVLG
jgi:hypothetical protein